MFEIKHEKNSDIKRLSLQWFDADIQLMVNDSAIGWFTPDGTFIVSQSQLQRENIAFEIENF